VGTIDPRSAPTLTTKIRQGAFNLAHLRDVLDSMAPISCSRNVAQTRRLLALRRRWRSIYATRRL
jgi:hypothetical protein